MFLRRKEIKMNLEQDREVNGGYIISSLIIKHSMS